MRLTNKCPSRSLAILRFALPAQVVKLVDTLASGASARKGVEVQVLSWAPFPNFKHRVSRTKPLTFNHINRSAVLWARANSIYGHPYGLPRKDPSSESHGA